MWIFYVVGLHGEGEYNLCASTFLENNIFKKWV
jgi:hypothetical protein